MLCSELSKWHCLLWCLIIGVGVFLLLPIDHIALIIELLGKVPRKLILAGKYSKEFFTKKGKHARPATSCLLQLNPVELLEYARYFQQKVLFQTEHLMALGNSHLLSLRTELEN